MAIKINLKKILFFVLPLYNNIQLLFLQNIFDLFTLILFLILSDNQKMNINFS